MQPKSVLCITAHHKLEHGLRRFGDEIELLQYFFLELESEKVQDTETRLRTPILCDCDRRGSSYCDKGVTYRRHSRTLTKVDKPRLRKVEYWMKEERRKAIHPGEAQ